MINEIYFKATIIYKTTKIKPCVHVCSPRAMSSSSVNETRTMQYECTKRQEREQERERERERERETERQTDRDRDRDRQRVPDNSRTTIET